MGHNRSNKREIYQRGNESRKAACDPSIGMDLDVAALVFILRQPEDSGFRKGLVIFGINLNMYTVKLFDNVANIEGDEIPQANQPPI